MQTTAPATDFDDGKYQDSSTYEEDQREFMKELIDVKPLLDDFEHRVLRGEYLAIDAESGTKGYKRYDPNAKPIINEIGIREIMGRLLGFANQITRMSYYEDEEIYKNMFYFDMSLTELVSKRAGIWELDIETAKAIKDAAIEIVQSVMFCARNGFTAINVRTTYSKQDVTRTDASEQKKGGSFLGIPLGGRK